MRIINELMEYINNTTDLTITDVDIFQDELSEKLMLKATSSDANSSRYYSNSRIGQFSFDIYCKNSNSQLAVSRLNELEKVLDLPFGLRLKDDFQLIKGEIVQSAHILEKTEKNEFIYISSFNLEYYYKK